MFHDPMRAQSRALVAGCILAAIAIAGCAIFAFLRPQGALGSAPIVVTQNTGALYVRLGDTLHPVFNLASARLIAGSGTNPVVVSESELGKVRRGPLLGIPGAPWAIAQSLQADESGWTVCDTATAPPAVRLTTTVIAGDGDAESGAHRLPPEHMVLVTTRSGGVLRTYLIHDGRRSAVDLGDPAVMRALRLEGIAPRPVSLSLLNTIPEAPPIAPPLIPGAGSAGPPSMAGFGVGTVVRVARADAVEHYVVLAGGVQRVGQVTADLIRFTDSQGSRDIPTVTPDAIRTTPTVTVLPVSTFPERVGTSTGVGDDPVLCLQWMPGQPGTAELANTALLVGDALPLDAAQTPVTLAQSDGDGPDVDAVFLPPGRSAYVRPTGITGDHSRAESLFLVVDTGVRFGVHNAEVAHDLGLPSSPVPAPWPVLKLLPGGPELSKANALVARDGVMAGVFAAPAP